MRVAFDLDGVFADMHTALSQEAERLFGATGDAAAETLEDALEQPEMVRPPGPSHVHLTSRQTERLWDSVKEIENFWEGLPELEPGAVARLARVAGERGWEVVFLTQRPATRGATVQQQTQRWLRQQGFELPSVCTTRGSRGAVAASLHLDAVVDDRFDSCADVLIESDARALLVWREPEVSISTRARGLGITVVRSVGECLDILEQLDQHAGTAPGLIGRLKDALRLKRR